MLADRRCRRNRASGGNWGRTGAHYPLVNLAWKHLGVGAATLSLATAASLTAGTLHVDAPAATAAPAMLLASKKTAGSATGRGMAVTGAFLPLPASPAVASVYLVFHNLTARPDALLSVGTSIASSSMAMSEGSTSMSTLGSVTIPAHRRVSFVPGHDHLMLQGLTRKLAVGQTVVVNLRFRHAGIIHLKIPVVPLDRILGAGASPAARTGSAGSTRPMTSTTMGRMAGM